MRQLLKGKNIGKSVRVAAVMALAALSATTGRAQPNGDTWQNLQEIVKFTESHMSDEVIISYIKTSGKVYPTSADALLYLNSHGVSQPVLAALLGAPAPAAPAAEAVITAPPATPTIDYFQAHLTPYGQWIDVPGIGAAWVPAEANNPAWRPYMDAGHWQFTDAGWFWQSDYPWGDMAFHYGRWIKSEFTGGRWGWVPGYDWAPSWVSWREGGGGMGWAPLPWGVEFHAGHGLFWHGAEVTAGVDFGLGFDTFVFVGNDHFWGGNYNLYVYDRERSRTFFEHSTFHAGFVMEGGHLRAEGLGRDHMAEITHHEVVVRPVVELRHAEETHNFAKRAEEHKELARVPAHVKEPAHPEANHAVEAHKGAAASEKASAGHAPETHAAAPAKEANGHAATSEKAATTHTPETHSMTPAKEPTTHPAATSEKESTTHASEAHSAAPPSTHPAAKEPAAPARPPAVAPKPPASTANPKPGTPGKGATNSTPRP